MMWLSMTVGLFLAAPPTEADRLFAKGRELLKKRPVEACQLFEKSFHLDPALGALLNLALCQESIEHWASAWLNFNRAREWAARTHEGDREALAKKHVETLAPKLSWVAISAAQPAPGLETELDGQKAAYGGPWSVAVDPGPHTFAASAPGCKGWRTSIVAPPPGQSLAVVVPELEPLVAPEPVDAPSPLAPPLVSASVEPPGVAVVAPPAVAPSPTRAPALVAVVGGSVLVAGGAVALGWTLNVYSRAQSQRVGQPAAPLAVTRAEFDTARMLYPMSLVALGVGAVSIGVGSFLIARRPVTVGVVTTGDGALLTASGAF